MYCFCNLKQISEKFCLFFCIVPLFLMRSEVVFEVIIFRWMIVIFVLFLLLVFAYNHELLSLLLDGHWLWRVITMVYSMY